MKKNITFSIKANLNMKITYSESAQKGDSNECNFDYFFIKISLKLIEKNRNFKLSAIN